MAIREADVGAELTLVKGGDGIGSLAESVSASESRGWHFLYERERVRGDEAEARAKVAEAQAQQWRLAEIGARSKAGSWKAMFEAGRDKVAEAREETKAMRRTAKEALSLQAEVGRLRKWEEAAGLPSSRCPGRVSLRKQVGQLRQKNTERRQENAASSPALPAMAAPRGRGLRNGSKSIARRRRRACVRAAARRMRSTARIAPRSSRSRCRRISGGSCVRAGGGSATARPRRGKSPRRRPIGCFPARPTAPPCGRACCSSATSATGP